MTDALLARVRKLLAKAEDPACTPAEAEAFTAKATELIAKYGVDQALLAEADPARDPVGDRVVALDPPYALDKAGLLLDFKDLREVMRHVIDRLDHQMINEIEPFTMINPSAENLARYFYDETNRQLNEMTGGRVAVKDCTIWETDTTTATYYE